MITQIMWHSVKCRARAVYMCLCVCRPSVKPGHDYERLKLQCMKAMSDLQSLQNQHTKTLKRCEEAVRDADYYQ